MCTISSGRSFILDGYRALRSKESEGCVAASLVGWLWEASLEVPFTPLALRLVS